MCKRDFDFIVKFESMDIEGNQDYFYNEINFKLIRVIPFSGSHLKSNIFPKSVISDDLHLNDNHGGKDTEDVTKVYFETLSDQDIMDLYQIYEHDFKMFDYTFRFRNITLPLN